MWIGWGWWRWRRRPSARFVWIEFKALSRRRWWRWGRTCQLWCLWWTMAYNLNLFLRKSWVWSWEGRWWWGSVGVLSWVPELWGWPLSWRSLGRWLLRWWWWWRQWGSVRWQRFAKELSFVVLVVYLEGQCRR